VGAACVVVRGGQEVEATIRKKARKRTQGDVGEQTNQNGYLWGVLIRMIADDIGELDQDAVHDWILLAVGHFKVMPDGTKIAATTSDMEAGRSRSYASGSRYGRRSRRIRAGLGLYLPDPHEVDYDR